MVKFIAGIDEAGRGPIIGPLVICAAAIMQDKEFELKELGVKDSKLLTQKQREDIMHGLLKAVKYELVIIEPSEIDEAVESQKYNLNWLEADKSMDLLNKLDIKLDNDVELTYVDCPSNNINAYADYLKEKLDNKEIKLAVEHKADYNHLIVGAASIIAKVTREKELERLKKKLDVEFGSGYPSDPRTQEFIKTHHANPKYSKIIRKSWQTYKNVAKNQSKLGQF